MTEDARQSTDSVDPADSAGDVRRKFREALERKQARGSEPRDPQHGEGRGVGPASNDKRQRQFRRKSG